MWRLHCDWELAVAEDGTTGLRSGSAVLLARESSAQTSISDTTNRSKSARNSMGSPMYPVWH
jgi:hypothetical protein